MALLQAMAIKTGQNVAMVGQKFKVLAFAKWSARKNDGAQCADLRLALRARAFAHLRARTFVNFALQAMCVIISFEALTAL